MQHTTPNSPDQEKKSSITPGPWNICWGTYDGKRVNFHITASPYGSVFPICETRWAHDWSEEERERIEANALAIAALPDLIEAAKKAIRNWEADENLDNLDHAMIALRDVLSRIQGGK